MQNKKVTMLAAVLAVTVIAMAGVGYATVYHATTTNDTNSMDSTYVILSQNSTAQVSAAYGGNFLTDLCFDTVNTAPTTTDYIPVYTGTLANNVYTPNSAVKSTTENAVALISKDLTLHVQPTNVSDDTGVLTVTISGTFTEQTDLQYWMLLTGKDSENSFKLAAQSATDSTTHITSWTFSGVPIKAAHDYSVQLFVKMTGTTVANATTGFADSDDTEKTTFTFELTAGSN